MKQSETVTNNLVNSNHLHDEQEYSEKQDPECSHWTGQAAEGEELHFKIQVLVLL